MPTTLHRSQITHTRAVRHALELAEQRWPDQSPGALLVRLIEEGARAVEDEMRDEEHRQRVREIAGRYAGVFGPDYLSELREDWDE